MIKVMATKDELQHSVTCMSKVILNFKKQCCYLHGLNNLAPSENIVCLAVSVYMIQFYRFSPIV